MVELCGARLVPGTIDVAAEAPPPVRIALRTDRVERLLGERIEAQESGAILERLGFGVEYADGDLLAEVPYFRASDVQREADLIEEVARIHGLERLPTTLPPREQAIGALSHQQKLRRLAEDLLRDRGLSEVVTFSFIAEDAVERLRLPPEDERSRVLHVTNPLSEDQSAMRTTLLPGLLDVARHNVARDVDAVSVFEAGRVFLSNGSDEPPDERLQLGVLLAGEYPPGTWRSPAGKPDFYTAKALLAALLAELGVEWRLADGGPAFLHPGRSAQILAGGHEAGYLGELHPLVARSFGLDELDKPPAAFEIDLTEILEAAGGASRYVDLITYPAVLWDIAVIVDEAVEAQTVIESVLAAAGDELRSVRVFDVYRGEQVGEGRKSLALKLEFRAADRTLTDDEVAVHREQIKRTLANELGGTLRE